MNAASYDCLPPTEGQARARTAAAGGLALAEVDRTEQYPWDNVELLKDARLLGMTIPTQYGGQGKGWLDAVLTIEALSAACSVTGRIAVETNMGAISVMAYGSEEQKKPSRRHGARRRRPRSASPSPMPAPTPTDDHTRRQEGQPLCPQRPQPRDHRRRFPRLLLIFAKVYATSSATSEASAASSRSATRPRG